MAHAPVTLRDRDPGLLRDNAHLGDSINTEVAAYTVAGVSAEGDRIRPDALVSLCPDDVPGLTHVSGRVGEVMSGSGVEGRVGVSRRSAFGAPAGRYVEVESDLRFDGWLVRLFEADPRDGPGESTDVRAATEDDLWELLGPERLDVEWLTEPLPDDTLAELVGHRADRWRFRHVSAQGVARWLHDADVGLNDAGLAGRVAVVPGLVESTWELPKPRFGRGRLVPAKFPFLLAVEPATHAETADPEGIDQIIVGEVDYNENEQTLVINSAIPGHVQIRTSSRIYRLATRQHPALVRRWWRWSPLESGEGSAERATETAYGAVAYVNYEGPPRVNPTPSRTRLRRFGLPEPHETLEIHLTPLPTQARRELLSGVLAPLRTDDDEARLLRATRRHWETIATGDVAADELRAAVDSDLWWAGDIALVLHTPHGPGVVCSAADGEIMVVITGGYRRSKLRELVETAADAAVSRITDDRDHVDANGTEL